MRRDGFDSRQPDLKINIKGCDGDSAVFPRPESEPKRVKVRRSFYGGITPEPTAEQLCRVSRSAFPALKGTQMYVCRNRWFEAIYCLRPIMDGDFSFLKGEI